jgi:hypothetical protein
MAKVFLTLRKVEENEKSGWQFLLVYVRFLAFVGLLLKQFFSESGKIKKES